MPSLSNAVPFAKADQLPVNPSTIVNTTLLDPAWVWKMQVDPDHKLTFSPEIIIPDHHHHQTRPDFEGNLAEVY